MRTGCRPYGSISNYETCAERDVVPYIAFKSNHSGSGKGRSGKGQSSEGGKLWTKMFHTFQLHQDEFFTHYHQRSNVETVFSMIKAKFGGEVRSKTEIAALNEVLCKIVCHNICCLISATFELGLDLEHLLPSRPSCQNFQAVEGVRARV
ncbi:MAG TPA: transposase [Rhizomicrobium sp.]|nr:transposase [Rhizomicrobium sp.]